MDEALSRPFQDAVVAAVNSASKQPLVDLLRTIREIGNGEILTIDVKHGLPFSAEVERRNCG